MYKKYLFKMKKMNTRHFNNIIVAVGHVPKWILNPKWMEASIQLSLTFNLISTFWSKPNQNLKHLQNHLLAIFAHSSRHT
jgi:hypothetical protein